MYNIFLKRKFTENVRQNTLSCTIDKKSAWGVCSNTPKYNNIYLMSQHPKKFNIVRSNTLSNYFYKKLFLYKKRIFLNKILAKYSLKRTKLDHF